MKKSVNVAPRRLLHDWKAHPNLVQRNNTPQAVPDHVNFYSLVTLSVGKFFGVPNIALLHRQGLAGQQGIGATRHFGPVLHFKLFNDPVAIGHNRIRFVNCETSQICPEPMGGQPVVSGGVAARG